MSVGVWQRPTAASLGLLVIVALIALAVRGGWTMALDRGLMRAMAPDAAFVPLVRAVSWFGNSTTRYVAAGIACLAAIASRRWRQAAVLALAVLGGAAFNSLLKLLVARPRPDLLAHLDHVDTTSFPSGHAAGAVTTYCAIALMLGGGRRRGWLIAAAGLAGAIGVSRVMLAVHWPSDVAAGWFAGAAWLLLWRNLLPPRAAG